MFIVVRLLLDTSSSLVFAAPAAAAAAVGCMYVCSKPPVSTTVVVFRCLLCFVWSCDVSFMDDGNAPMHTIFQSICVTCEDDLVPFVLLAWLFGSFGRSLHNVIRVCFVRLCSWLILRNGMFGSCELRILLLFNYCTIVAVAIPIKIPMIFLSIF